MYNPYFNYGLGNYPQNYPQFPQDKSQPIQNIINTQMPTTNVFMAQFLKENESVDNMFVNYKTAFIDLKGKQLVIKDIDGSITSYGLILPMDEKDKRINELENEIYKLKEKINYEQSSNVSTDTKSTQQNTNAKKYDRK